ncbi:MAG: arsenate reductase ArsC [Campylobacterales bacterium]|nr:arsenate reductase ArsC [Campylobacterales bacterium]
MKKVLILCTKNSCRSIVAEALINKYLNNMRAYSAGIEIAGEIDPYAKQALENEEAWSDEYYSKTLDKIIDTEFDLVITVCGDAEEKCPAFPKKVEVIHIGFENPEGEAFEAYEQSLQEIKEKLLPIVRKKMS